MQAHFASPVQKERDRLYSDVVNQQHIDKDKVLQLYSLRAVQNALHQQPAATNGVIGFFQQKRSLL